jgi:hypothetical protein
MEKRMIIPNENQEYSGFVKKKNVSHLNERFPATLPPKKRRKYTCQAFWSLRQRFCRGFFELFFLLQKFSRRFFNCFTSC